MRDLHLHFGLLADCLSFCVGGQHQNVRGKQLGVGQSLAVARLSYLARTDETAFLYAAFINQRQPRRTGYGRRSVRSGVIGARRLT
jgi:hypothetical protein